jgi:CRP/FNR family transcriptional regulator
MWCPSTCIHCAVRSRALCRALPSGQLSQLSRVAHRRRYEPGRVIVVSDQPQDWFANVLSGVVKLTRTLPDGREQIVGLLFPGDFLGRPYRELAACAVETATAVEVCCFGRRRFEELLEEQPALRQLLLERTLDEIDAAREWILLLGRGGAAERVAALVLLVARRLQVGADDSGAATEPIHIELPLSRTEMAEYLGLRTETVSRQLRRLKVAGLIEMVSRRSLTVRDIAALEHFVQKEYS